LEGPHVGGDEPPIADRNLFGITLHRAEPVRDDIEKIAHAFLPKAILVITRRLSQTALHDHAIAIAKTAVAGRAVDIEALLTALDVVVGNRERDRFDQLTIQLARMQRFILAQPPARDSACGRRS
jgi:hypothetical protein